MLDQVVWVVSVTFLVMVSPGPDMLIVVRNTMTGGRRAGLLTSVGVLAGNLVHITYCLLGIGWLISRSTLASAALAYAGAAYLVYLGVMSFRPGTTTLEAGNSDGESPRKSWFTQGFVNNVLNPKGTLFYLGVFGTVIVPETSAGAKLVLILCMLSVSASFWLIFVHALDRPILRSAIERSQLIVNRVFGILLVLIGMRVATMVR